MWWETHFKMMTTNILLNDPATNTMVDPKTDSMTDRRHDLPPDQEQGHGYDQNKNMLISVSYSCYVFFSVSVHHPFRWTLNAALMRTLVVLVAQHEAPVMGI